MAYHSLELFVIMLAFSFIVSSNAVPMSRLKNLQNGSGHIMATQSMNQDLLTSEDTMEDNDVVEGRMDIEKNDYGATTSNPVHTPRPPRT